ncbi:hypothetical protein M5689_016522 [Euphorbia peplus]|nr:hypothetical protein M5689_016522 [Euphorbia peplus]
MYVDFTCQNQQSCCFYSMIECAGIGISIFQKLFTGITLQFFVWLHIGFIDIPNMGQNHRDGGHEEYVLWTDSNLPSIHI